MIKRYIAISFSLFIFSNMCLAEDINHLITVADTNRGERISAVCRACHAVKKNSPNMLGPNLFEVVERKTGSVTGYDYSPALSAFNSIWTIEQLDHFLLNPQKMIPGTKMAFAGFKQATDRAAIIAWLRLQADDPIALPVSSNSDEKSVDINIRTEDPDLALLPEGPGKENVFYTCSTCHSIKLVVQQGMDREDWADTLEWMVEEQAMNELDENSLELILDYLSSYLGTNR